MDGVGGGISNVEWVKLSDARAELFAAEPQGADLPWRHTQAAAALRRRPPGAQTSPTHFPPHLIAQSLR